MRDGEHDQQDPEIDRREDRRTRARDQGVGRRRLEEEDGVDVPQPSRKTCDEQRTERDKADGQRGDQEAVEDGPAQIARAACRAECFPQQRSFVDLTEAADEPDREQVHHERHDEERCPDREDRLVLDRPCRDIALAGGPR